MTVKIIVPSLGESVTEATIAKWYKKPGDSVKVDELIVELETEKVTLEVNSPATGAIADILHPEGASVKVGELIGNVNEGAAGSAPSAPASVPAAVSTPQASAPTPLSDADKSNILSPSANKIALDANLNTASIDGTGKDGRINKGDVLNVLATTTVRAPEIETVIPGDKPVEKVRMSRLRKTIAQRLKDSQNTAAILTTFNEIDMLNVINLRKKHREEFEKKHGVKLGFMSFFVKAVVNALKEIPAVNAEIDGGDIIYKRYYDIGVAVGTDQGLVVPVLRNADKMSFSTVEKEIGHLAAKARDGKLAMVDLTGGTFSITNGGVYGSLLSTPIINPPQSGIIGLHNTQERPVVIDGKIEIRPMMYIALSYDHRIIDGKDAVTFLVKVKNAIENPERLLFDL